MPRPRYRRARPRRKPLLLIGAAALVAILAALWYFWPQPPSEEEEIMAQVRVQRERQQQARMSAVAYARANEDRLSNLAFEIQALEAELSTAGCLDPARVRAFRTEADAVRTDYVRSVADATQAAPPSLFTLLPFVGRSVEAWTAAERTIQAAPAVCPEVQSMITNLDAYLASQTPDNAVLENEVQ